MVEGSVDDAALERYLLLGLQLGRHVDGAVDAYFGPPEMASAVESEPLVEAAALLADAESLLDELVDGWLRDQSSAFAPTRRTRRRSPSPTPTSGRLLMNEELTAHMIRFLGEPTSRTYPITYAVGRELCHSYVAGDPQRFRRLLTEQVRVAELVAAAEARTP